MPPPAPTPAPPRAGMPLRGRLIKTGVLAAAATQRVLVGVYPSLSLCPPLRGDERGPGILPTSLCASLGLGARHT